MNISLNQIEYNPHRDLSAYPLDDKHIGTLIESINQTGFWDNILVRKHPHKAKTYQLAYGHHRLEAALQCGIKKGDIPCRNLSDDDMLHIMVKENATQAGGQSVAASLDSVKAILRRLSYLMLTNDYEHFGRILPKCFESEKAFDCAHGRLLSGNGLGKWVISNYDSSLTEWAIRPALGTLKADGSFKDILHETRALIKTERQRMAEVAEEMAEEIKKEAEKEKRAVEKRAAEKLASDKRMVILKARKEEEKIKQEQAKADKLTALIKEEHERAEKMRVAAEKTKLIIAEKKAKMEQAENDAIQAAESVDDATMGKGIAKYFNNSHQLFAFKKALSSSTAVQFIPISQHEALAKAVIESADVSGIQATGVYISSYIQSILDKALGTQKRVKNKEEGERQAAANDRNAALNAFRQSLDSTNKNLANLELNFNTLIHTVRNNPNLLDVQHLDAVTVRAKRVQSKIIEFISILETTTNTL